jgi:catechol 2,3-dioxygenase-like lactoylglutathione lyase family enzyme
MLNGAHAFAKLPVTDIERARRFYVDVLGLQVTIERPGHLYFDHADGSTILVFRSSGKASGNHDQCGWIVGDVDAAVAELKRRGVVFEEFPGIDYEKGISANGIYRSAWFRDPDGNLLNVRSRQPREG